MGHSYQHRGNVSSRFLSNSEANASELLRNIEEMYSRYYMLNDTVIANNNNIPKINFNFNIYFVCIDICIYDLSCIRSGFEKLQICIRITIYIVQCIYF